MDPLSQTVALLKPQAVIWRVLELPDSWGIRFPAYDAVKFGQLIEGECEIRLADGQGVLLSAGDFLLVSTKEPWIMRAPGSSQLADLKSVLADPDRFGALAASGPGPRFFAGAFTFAAPNADLVAGLIPPIIRISAGDAAGSRLGALLRGLGEEVLADRPGRSLIIDRMLEIMLVESLRHRDPEFAEAQRGLIAGLGDPKIAAALRALHAETGKAWTVAALARQAGMSRSAFATRFAELVGASPIGYLSRWRMTLAKNALAEARLPMADIAEIAGYQSVSAFSTAFRRVTGIPPSAFRKNLDDR